MENELKKAVQDARQWVEQEKVWGDSMYATTPHPAPPPPSNLCSASRLGHRSSDASDRWSPSRGEGTSGVKTVALKSLYEKYKDCTRCQLGFTRIKFVFGVGNPDSEVLFIGEGPGYEEDRRGEPFVGKSGQLLDKMMAAIGLSRQTNAYIANIVKCHPMDNPQTPDARSNDRPPSPEEVNTCSPILLQQIAIMKPRVIMTLGSPSTKMVLHTKDAITGLRGKIVPFDVDYFYPVIAAVEELKLDVETREALRTTQVIPTYHPAALLRNPNLKPESWADLKLLRDTLSHK
jgi:uracil-DNA glycosylase family 4